MRDLLLIDLEPIASRLLIAKCWRSTRVFFFRDFDGSGLGKYGKHGKHLYHASISFFHSRITAV